MNTQQREEQLNNEQPISQKSDYNFDPDLIPANIDLAIKHQLAHRVGINSKEICPCCGYHIKFQQLSLTVDKEDLTFLGSGYPLYFSFIKNCILLLCIHFISVGQFSLISNIQGIDCIPQTIVKQKLKEKENDICVKDFVTILSTANRRKQYDLLFLNHALILTSSFLMMIFLLNFRKNQKKLDVFCDLQELTPSDYTIMVYNIKNPELLKQYFEEQLFNKEIKIKVKKINLAYDTQEILKLEQEKKKILKKMKEDYKKNKQLNHQELNDINQQIDIISKQCKFSGLAFISFKYERMKTLIINTAKNSYCMMILNTVTGLNFFEAKELNINNESIYIQVAPEPPDINWNVIYTWANSSGSRKIIGALINLFVNILLSICAYISMLKQNEILSEFKISYEEQEDTYNQHYITVHLYSLFYSLITVIINSLILVEVTKKIVQFQSFITYSLISKAIAKKLSFMMFLNSACIQYILSLIDGNLYYPGGLVYNMTYFFITNALFPPLIKLINIPMIISKLKRYYYSHFSILHQSQANKLFKLPKHQIESGYADIIKTLNITFLFGPFIPISYIFSMIGLILYYWVEKYNLLRKNSIKYTPSFELSSQMTDSLQLIPIILLLSSFIFQYVLFKQISYCYLIGVIIILFVNYLPNDFFINQFLDYNEQDEYEKYSEHNFQFDYDRLNPITQKKALRRWIKKQAKYEVKQVEKMQKFEDYAALKEKEKDLQMQLEFFE